MKKVRDRRRWSRGPIYEQVVPFEKGQKADRDLTRRGKTQVISFKLIIFGTLPSHLYKLILYFTRTKIFYLIILKKQFLSKKISSLHLFNNQKNSNKLLFEVV